MSPRVYVNNALITEAEETWQYVLQDRKKRKSANSVTAYCERIAKVYSKNPPALPKPSQKMRLLDRVKKNHIPERPPPLPPLVPNIVPNIVSMCYPTLPMPGENGVKQHYKTVDIGENTEEVSEKRDKSTKWTGIEDIMYAYKEYLKGACREFSTLHNVTLEVLISKLNVYETLIRIDFFFT